uniref:Uncharacterized protein n=1 Tax=Arundo donax TaxID=35708 RepID=A0A0A9A440_ARUDO
MSQTIGVEGPVYIPRMMQLIR